MHELSIASGLVEKLIEFVTEHPERKLLEVRLAIGELTHIDPEQLRFCYTAVTTGTPIEDSILEVEKVDALVECPHCSYRGKAKYWQESLAYETIATLQCPDCGKTAAAIEGNDCAIKTVKFRESASRE